jgi:hypothetical protein
MALVHLISNKLLAWIWGVVVLLPHISDRETSPICAALRRMPVSHYAGTDPATEPRGILEMT